MSLPQRVSPDTISRMTPGERFASLRKKHLFSQESLAARIGATGKTISNFELGVTETMNNATMKGAAEAFGMSVDAFMDQVFGETGVAGRIDPAAAKDWHKYVLALLDQADIDAIKRAGEDREAVAQVLQDVVHRVLGNHLSAKAASKPGVHKNPYPKK